MKPLSVLAIVLVFLLLAAPESLLAAPSSFAPLATLINDRSVATGDQAVMVNGVILVPLRTLAERLGFAVGWLEETRTIRIQAYDQVIYLPLGNKVGLANGRSFKLSEPAQVLSGRTYVPLRFLSEILNFEVHYSAGKRRVEIRAPEYAVTDVRYALVDGRPQVILNGTRTPVAQATLKQNPLRLVLDLPWARLAIPAGTLPTDDPLVREVAWRQERRDLVRLTVSLGREMPYQLVSTDQRLSVVFPPQVRSAALIVDEGRRLIAIRSTAPLKPVVRRLSDPDRLVIDLPGAALAAMPRVLLNDAWVQALRLGQLDAETVRVVADMEGPLGWVEESTGTRQAEEGDGREQGAVWTLHLLNRVTEVTHQTFKDRTQLRLKLAVAATPTVVDRQAGRLELDLAEAMAEGLPSEVAIGDGTVERLRLLEAGPGTVRWRIDLPYYVGHRILPGKAGEAVVEISRSPVYRKKIFLDPGHGGADPGAMGPSGLMEKEVNLDLALRLRQILAEAGAEVTLSRESDLFVPLHERPRVANSLEADIFISLHANANPKTWESGTETYYHPDRPDSRELAAALEKQLLEALRLRDRSIRPTREFVVIREASMPSVLVEVAFLSNPAEERLLADPQFRQNAAAAIAEGIMAYFRQYPDARTNAVPATAGT
ncbi:MAG: N-acetylmuramoyl-L-alanine amidase [Betaproteobacteria bacterium]